MLTVEFFFDCSSPWTYLSFHRMVDSAEELDLPVDWRPILVGGIFNSTNPSVYHAREHPVAAKQRYMVKDLQDWARHSGLRIHWPVSVFPVNSVTAMRGCLAADEAGLIVAFARAVFEVYWGRDEDISRDEILAPIASSVGLEAEAFFARIAAPEIKAPLRANTDELVARGGYGSPTVFVRGDDMYFGNDRMPLIREAIQRERAAA